MPSLSDLITNGGPPPHGSQGARPEFEDEEEGFGEMFTGFGGGGVLPANERVEVLTLEPELRRMLSRRSRRRLKEVLATGHLTAARLDRRGGKLHVQGTEEAIAAARLQLETLSGPRSQVPRAVWAELMRTRMEPPALGQVSVQALFDATACRVHIERGACEVRLFGMRSHLPEAQACLEAMAQECAEEAIDVGSALGVGGPPLSLMQHIGTTCSVTVAKEGRRVLVLGLHDAVAEGVAELQLYLTCQKDLSVFEADGQVQEGAPKTAAQLPPARASVPPQDAHGRMGAHGHASGAMHQQGHSGYPGPQGQQRQQRQAQRPMRQQQAPMRRQQQLQQQQQMQQQLMYEQQQHYQQQQPRQQQDLLQQEERTRRQLAQQSDRHQERLSDMQRQFQQLNMQPSSPSQRQLPTSSQMHMEPQSQVSEETQMQRLQHLQRIQQQAAKQRQNLRQDQRQWNQQQGQMQATMRTQQLNQHNSQQQQQQRHHEFGSQRQEPGQQSAFEYGMQQHGQSPSPMHQMQQPPRHQQQDQQQSWMPQPPFMVVPCGAQGGGMQGEQYVQAAVCIPGNYMMPPQPGMTQGPRTPPWKQQEQQQPLRPGLQPQFGGAGGPEFGDADAYKQGGPQGGYMAVSMLPMMAEQGIGA